MPRGQEWDPHPEPISPSGAARGGLRKSILEKDGCHSPLEASDRLCADLKASWAPRARPDQLLFTF